MLKDINKTFRDNYVQKKKEYDKLLIVFKKRQYINKINASDNRTKTTWSIINEINGKNKKKNVNLEGNNTDLANNFNVYVSTAATKLLQDLGDVLFSTEINYCEKFMVVVLVDENEILGIVKSLKNKISSGNDEISTSLFKFSITAIVKPLVHIINNSLTYGIFPDKLKQALVIPVYKKGDETQIENYRPISLLSCFSKIFKKVMSNRITEHMLENNLINNNQHGYLKGRSTQTALFQFTENIIKSLENKQLPIGLFLDLSKAYDTLNYTILTRKLELYGIRGIVLKWVISYLTHRKQKVVIGHGVDRVSSEYLEVTLGVPQGSVIGPLLFILYTNDITELCDNSCVITNYADDTNLLLTASSLPTLIDNTKLVMSKASDWFTKNKLILNSSKTNIVLFKTSRSKILPPEEICIKNASIKLNNSTKFLGMILDSNLCYDKHIDSILSRLGKVCYTLRVLRQYLDYQTMKVVYHSNFESHIRYGIIVYGSCRDIERLFICQKRALRIILGISQRETCREKFKQSKLLTITAIYIQECILFFYRKRNLFGANESQNLYHTRTLNYTIPGHRLNISENGAYYSSIKLYNSLPIEIKNLQNIRLFKKALYRFLLEIEPYNMEEYYGHL